MKILSDTRASSLCNLTLKKTLWFLSLNQHGRNKMRSSTVLGLRAAFLFAFTRFRNSGVPAPQPEVGHGLRFFCITSFLQTHDQTQDVSGRPCLRGCCFSLCPTGHSSSRFWNPKSLATDYITGPEKPSAVGLSKKDTWRLLFLTPISSKGTLN